VCEERYGLRAAGRVLDLVVTEKGRCYPERANKFGTSDLAGKAQYVECAGSLRDGGRETGGTCQERRGEGGTKHSSEWGGREFAPSVRARPDSVHFGVGFARGSCELPPRHGIFWRDLW
jgi:hypothetical protein